MTTSLPSSHGAATPVYVRRSGDGPAVVLLHGWGLHGGVWEDMGHRLAGARQVVVPDLPGFGRSRDVPAPYDLPALVAAVTAAVPPGAIWVGWSLGGLVALAAAMARPRLVAGLVLVGATPKFVRGPDWTYGMRPEVLAGFVAELERDYQGTLQRFLALQGGRDAAGRALVRRLRGELARHGEPAGAALRGGLEILRVADLRGSLGLVDIPVRLVHGQRDMLVSPGAAQYLAVNLPDAHLTLIPGAGHAPFLSHPDTVVAAVDGLARSPAVGAIRET
jgi:pimeloyl-[acyl-carrier protein] methyl ester esterase